MAFEAVAAVTFDCWGTLLYESDPAASWERRVAVVASAGRALGVAADPAAARRALDTAWRCHFEAWQTEVSTGAEEIAAWALGALAPDAGPARADAAFARAARRLADALAEVPLAGGVRALAGARETLARLADAGVRRALVCDTGLSPGRVVRRLLAAEGLLEHLEVTVFSDEVGAPKPRPEPFSAALQALALGGSPARALHVGDLRRTDVAGARALGMRTVRIRDHHDDLGEGPEADAVADSHAQLLALLGLG